VSQVGLSRSRCQIARLLFQYDGGHETAADFLWPGVFSLSLLELVLKGLSHGACNFVTGRRGGTLGAGQPRRVVGGAIPRWDRQSICRRRRRPLAAAPLEAQLATAIFVGIFYTTARKLAASASCNYPTD